MEGWARFHGTSRTCSVPEASPTATIDWPPGSIQSHKQYACTSTYMHTHVAQLHLPFLGNGLMDVKGREDMFCINEGSWDLCKCVCVCIHEHAYHYVLVCVHVRVRACMHTGVPET